jgi:plastocyanin
MSLPASCALPSPARRPVTVTLKRGRYEYYCKPHRSIGMKGFFRVS